MLDSIPAELFLEWREYAETNPFGEERADLRAAIIAWTFFNKMRGKSERPKGVQEFMAMAFLGKGSKKRRQSTMEIDAILKAQAQAHNARVERMKKPNA